MPISSTLGILLLASTGFAIGNSLVTPTLNAMASRSVNASWQGRVLGVMQSAASLARIIGPVLGGVLLTQQDKSSPAYGRAPFWAGAAIMFIAFILAMTLRGSTAPAGKAVTPAEF
jgi:DHA1 family tetracycline resistance protein-like MFS transporter